MKPMTATTMTMTMVNTATTVTNSTHGGHLLSLTPHLLREYTYTVVTSTSPTSLLHYHLHPKWAVTTYLAFVFTWAANGINLKLLMFIWNLSLHQSRAPNRSMEYHLVEYLDSSNNDSASVCNMMVLNCFESLFWRYTTLFALKIHLTSL